MFLLIKLFSKLVKREGDNYFVVTPSEKICLKAKGEIFSIIDYKKEDENYFFKTNKKKYLSLIIFIIPKEYVIYMLRIFLLENPNYGGILDNVMLCLLWQFVQRFSEDDDLFIQFGLGNSLFNVLCLIVLFLSVLLDTFSFCLHTSCN